MHRRVFLVRHCQSEANRDQRAEARGDSSLTELGLEQARRRAHALADHQLAAVTVVSSPLERAVHTAREIAGRHGWDLLHDERLVEGDLGRMEGLAYEEVLAQVPEGATWACAELHGGESLQTVGDRMLEALAAALAKSSGPVIVVSHGYAIDALLQRLGEDSNPLANGDMIELHLDESAAVHQMAHHPLGH